MASVITATRNSTVLATRLDRPAGLSMSHRMGRMMHLLLIAIRDQKIVQSWQRSLCGPTHLGGPKVYTIYGKNVMISNRNRCGS